MVDVVFDFRGAAQREGVREDADDSQRGPMIIIPEREHGRVRRYVDVFPFDSSPHASNKKEASLQCAVDYAAENDLTCNRQPELAFCDGETADGLLTYSLLTVLVIAEKRPSMPILPD